MGKHKENVCPGCSRHCPLDHVRCKYGQKYIKKMQNSEASRPRRKWEKHVTQGGLVWKLLWIAGNSKRALRKRETTEEAILAPLSSEEQAQLLMLLEKLGQNAK